MNYTDVQLALRAQALTLSSVTTGSTSLAATTTGYTRAAGSFVTDGFLPGMEVTPSGFASNTPRLVTAVAASTLTVDTSRVSMSAESASSGRTLTVGLPAVRAYDNQRVALVAERWAVEEDFQVTPQRLLTLAGSNGTVRRSGLYVLRFYIPTRYGMGGPSRVLDDVLALYTPESTLSVTGGDTARIDGLVGPSRSGFLPAPQGAGWALVAVTVPWYVLTTNS